MCLTACTYMSIQMICWVKSQISMSWFNKTKRKPIRISIIVIDSISRKPTKPVPCRHNTFFLYCISKPLFCSCISFIYVFFSSFILFRPCRTFCEHILTVSDQVRSMNIFGENLLASEQISQNRMITIGFAARYKLPGILKRPVTRLVETAATTITTTTTTIRTRKATKATPSSSTYKRKKNQPHCVRSHCRRKQPRNQNYLLHS